MQPSFLSFSGLGTKNAEMEVWTSVSLSLCEWLNGQSHTPASSTLIQTQSRNEKETLIFLSYWDSGIHLLPLHNLALLD